MQPLKVWWVIAWDTYYPEHGLDNVRGTFATEKEAREFAEQVLPRSFSYDHVEIVNVDVEGILR